MCVWASIVLLKMWTSIVLLYNHCCLESVCLCAGNHRAAEGSLFGVCGQASCCWRIAVVWSSWGHAFCCWRVAVVWSLCVQASCCWRITVVWSMWANIVLLKDHCCLEFMRSGILLLKDHCCLEFVSKHRAAEGSFLFAASVASSHEWLSHILLIKWGNTIKQELYHWWINVLLISLLSQNTADVSHIEDWLQIFFRAQELVCWLF